MNPVLIAAYGPDTQPDPKFLFVPALVATCVLQGISISAMLE